ncbi:MAG: TonB-dependent receptor [Opitutaceae bacterium]
MNTRSTSRLFALGVLALATCLPSYAGDIVGRVKDANTDGYLPGVDVKVTGTNRTATTDREGRFRIGNLPAGNYNVSAEFIGYDPVSQTVSVPNVGTTTADITLGSEVIQLAEFDVEGYREGRSLALQQKRTAGNVMDLISSDSVGSLPDRNVAEALARVPGVNIDVEAGEGRFVSIRGIEPTFNNVTLDGNTLAPPSVGGREGRATPLDVVGSGQVSQIEVIKSVTPDMDANALGGTVNIKSASGFDRDKRFIFGKVEVGQNSVADSTIVDTDVTYGDTFNDGTIGIALSANYSDRPYASEELQMNWGSDSSGPYPRQFELQPRSGTRTRYGINYNFEFRPDDMTQVYLRGIYNQFNDEYRQQEFIMEARRDPVRISPTLVQINRMRFEQRDFSREVDQTMLNVSGGMMKRFDNLKVSGDITYSFSQEDVPFIKSVQFRTGNLDYNASGGNPPPFEFEFGGFWPAYNDQNRYTSGEPERYPLRRFREEDSLVEETTWSPRVDFEWQYDNIGGYPGTFKAGAKYTTRNRFVNDNSVRPVNSSLNMATISPPGPGFSINDGRYTYPSNLDVDKAFVYLNSNRSDFTIDPIESASNSIEDDYDVDEDIIGLYLMGTVDFSEQLSMIYGVRYEKTNATLKAFEFQEGPDGGKVVPNEGEFDYDNVLPNLQFRYAVTPNSVLRFAFTGTIGRPQYEKASPIAVLEWDALPPDEILDPAYPNAGSLEIGNPELGPYESMNFDLAYEYYFQSGAMLSAGLFYKAIDNPIYQFSDEQDNVVYNGIPMERLSITSYRNADSATVSGLELNAVLPFSTFVSNSFLDGFGVDANATFINSSVDVIDRESDDLPFFRQPSRIYNLAFYFQKYGFSFRIAWNYQDESLRVLSSSAGSDEWAKPREYTDIQASYKINENFTVYANWQNIFDATNDQSFGPDSMLMKRSEYYGTNIRGGIRFLF